MSIHKAQGQTIQRVKIDLNKVFEKGRQSRGISAKKKKKDVDSTNDFFGKIQAKATSLCPALLPWKGFRYSVSTQKRSLPTRE